MIVGMTVGNIAKQISMFLRLTLFVVQIKPFYVYADYILILTLKFDLFFLVYKNIHDNIFKMKYLHFTLIQTLKNI